MGDKVYVVVEREWYEADSIRGVYKKKERAEEEKAKLDANNKKKDRIYFEIDEWDVEN